jgi:hypothetical protein
VVSIVVGAIGGFFDGLYSQGGVTGIAARRDEVGRTVYDLGTIGHVLTGGAAGFISYALNFAGAGFGVQIQVGPTAASLLAGIGGSEFLRRMRDDRQLREATRSLSRGVAADTETMQALLRSEEPHEEQP